MTKKLNALSILEKDEAVERHCALIVLDCERCYRSYEKHRWENSIRNYNKIDTYLDNACINRGSA